MTSSDKRNKLRAKTIGVAKQFKAKRVTWDGEEFEIRQPTVSQRIAIFEAAGIEMQAVGIERLTTPGAMRGQLEAGFLLTYVPETGERLFEEGDREGFFAQPPGGFADALGAEALAMTVGVEVPADLGKGSAEIPPASSSSDSPVISG